MPLNRFEHSIGLRYARAGRGVHERDGFVSFISGLSMAGIALGVAALVIVLSVMNGFQKEVRDKMLSVLSHVEVLAADTPITDWRLLAKAARLDSRVIAAAPFVSGQAMLSHTGSVRGVSVRGIDPAQEGRVADFIDRITTFGKPLLAPGESGIAVGKALADTLLISPGDQLTLIAPQVNGAATRIVPRVRRLTVSAVFESGHYEYDSRLVLMNIADAARLFDVSGVSGVRLKTSEMMRAPEIAAGLNGHLPGDPDVRDWSAENQLWFSAAKTEKRMMFIVLTLIVSVAAFNLVSMLVMAVTNKQADIAILRTLGASPASIMRIFVVQGALVGCLGTAIGLLIGVPLAMHIGSVMLAVERLFGFEFLPKQIFFFNVLPTDLQWPDVFTVAVVACVLAFLATLYPSWQASRVRPAQALRYE